MATGQELITQAVQDCFGGWYDADVVRSAPCREYLYLVRTGDGWKIADALWLPQ
jgi:hypothetical protein